MEIDSVTTEKHIEIDMESKVGRKRLSPYNKEKGGATKGQEVTKRVRIF